VIYAIDHVRGIQVLQVDRAALAPVRRRPSRRRRARDVGLYVSDNHDRVRPGQRMRFSVEALRLTGRAGPASVRVKIPSALTGVRAGRGARFVRRSRTFRFRVRRLRGIAVRAFSARVRRGARIGTKLEVVGFARAKGDQLALDDRGVDVSRVARRPQRVRQASIASLARAGPAPPLGVCLVRPRLRP